SGTVIDDENNQPIESATVAVWRAADSSLATGAITGDGGTFEIEGLQGGIYYVKVSFVGYVTATIDDVNLASGEGTAELGEIRLRPDMAFLDEVLVEEERSFMEVGIDKTVYNTRE